MTTNIGQDRQLQASQKGFVHNPDSSLTPAAQKDALDKAPAPANIWQPQAPSKVKAFAAGIASNTTAAPASIVELARGLKSDVDLIHEYCATQLDFVPVMGLQKGALGAIIDQRGGPFDLADAMVQLLRQAGYTANYMFGEARLTLAQASAWFGTSATDIWASRNLLQNNGIAVSVVNVGGIDYLDFNHIWVKVWIAGTAYFFDPSLKSYTNKTGVDLGAAMGYNQTTFLANARSGATITADYVKSLNRANIRNDLSTMTTTLVNWIKTNNHAASVEDLLGGKSINAITTGQRLTALPYQKPGTTPTEWTSIPAGYKATLNLLYDSPNINVTFYSADIYGKRLTVFFNASHQAELRLDGTLVATSSAQAVGGWNSMLFTVNHPYGSTWADQSVWMRLYTDQRYLVANAWGTASSRMASLHNNLFYKNLAAGGAANSEAVLGEQLAALYYAQNGENSRSIDLINRMTNCNTVLHHQLGLVGTYNDVPLMDISLFIGSTAALDNNYNRVQWNDTVAAMHGVTYEASSIQENTGPVGVSATTMIDLAAQAGQKIFDGKSANWLSNVKPNLLNYSASLLTDIENWYINAGWRVAIPENGSITLGGFNGYGYWALPSYGAFGILGGTKGSQATAVKNANPLPVPLDGKKTQPITIAFQDGNFNWNHTDLTIGSQAAPYGLSFSRHYYASNGNVDGPLGLGWTHNFSISAKVGSSSMQGLADNSAIAGAPALVELFVANDLLSDLTRPHDKFVIASLAAQWFGETLVNNVVSISSPTVSAQFVKLPNGTYVTPPKSTGTLIKNANNTFTYKTPQQVAYNFNLDGTIGSIVYPQGVTWNFSYTSGKLTQVSTGMGRVINLVYTATRLTSINDGTGRSVSFTVDASKNLTQVTDANTKLLKYGYDIPGRLATVYLPANPLSPILTNVFDSLGQVKEQKDAYNNSTFYYYAGYRTEIVSANGKKAISYMNRFGDVVKAVDQLGKVTLAEFDALRRMTKRTLPEGNRVEYTFDVNNNLTGVRDVAKVGSGLADIVQSFTYHPTFNSVATSVDALGQTTIFTYNATTGTLTNIQYPQVGGQTPQDSFTYTARGQIDTITDPVGIVTKMIYDTVTEKLNSTIVDYGTGKKNLTTNFGYNSRGDVTSVQNPRGFTRTFGFDVLRRNNLITESAPFSYQTKITFDDNNNVTKVERQTGGTPAWQTFQSTFSIDNKVLTSLDPSNDTVTYDYNNLRQLWKITDALNRVTEYLYDDAGRVATVRDPSLGTNIISQTYTDNGLLATVVDARNNSRSLTYDGFDRAKRTTFPDTTYEEIQSYDANGNVLVARNRDAQTITNTIDARGRLSTRTPQGEATTIFVYDLADKLLTASKPVVAGDPSTGTFTKNYDSAGRFYQEVYPDTKTFTHILDANGNPTRTTWSDGYYIERSFDEMDRMTGLKLNGATTNALTYSYDQLSRPYQIVRENSITTTYGFEIDNDLATVSHAFPGLNLVPSTLTYTYGTNAAGENTSKQVSNSLYMWHPQTAGTKTFGTASGVDTYPTINGVAQTYNNRGMLTSDGTASFGYNVDGQAVSATKTGASISMKYDPLGRQVDKTTNSVSTRQYFAGDQKLADYNSAGVLQNRYIYGAQGEIALKVDSAGTKTTYLHEGDGSVIATTDSAGAVLNRYSYSPMGESNNMTGTTFGYKGQVYDASLGMYTRTDGLIYAPDKGRANQPLSGSFLGDNKYGVTAPRAPVANGVDNSNDDNEVNLNPSIQTDYINDWGDNAIPPYQATESPVGHFEPNWIFDEMRRRGGAGSDKKKTRELTLREINEWLQKSGIRETLRDTADIVEQVADILDKLSHLGQKSSAKEVFRRMTDSLLPARPSKSYTKGAAHPNSAKYVGKNTVYAIYNKVTGEIVKIGQTVQKLASRLTQNTRQAVKENRITQDQRNKFGIEPIRTHDNTNSALNHESGILKEMLTSMKKLPDWNKKTN
ncbi:MAG: RHS repeat protein [Candidatus Melainabacteria bacterium]|nr:RHS repeat protein [Candidatus Melainabacteria bacterium]